MTINETERKSSIASGKLDDFFTWLDYIVFFVFILLSTGVGLFFTIKDRKNPSTSKYFMGQREMSVIPVAISMSVSFLSAIDMLGGAAETYLHGVVYYYLEIALLSSTILVSIGFLPFLYEMKITSVFEVSCLIST